MIGIILVSHSKKLAEAIRELVLQMVGPDFPIAVAAGVGDDHDALGTDAVHIAEVMTTFCQGDGAIVLMDLGSAVLSAETALELLDPDLIADPSLKLRLCPAPIVEAAIAAAVQAKAGAGLDAVADEALIALAPKTAQLGFDPGTPAGPVEAPAAPAGRALEFDVVVENPHGLHARPAATLVQLVGRFESDVSIANLTHRLGPSPARSLTSVALLQIRQGDAIHFSIRGDDADQAAAAIRRLAAERFGEDETPETPAAAAPAKLITPTDAEAQAGTAISDGIAIGRALDLEAVLPAKDDAPKGSPDEERRKLDAALEQVARDLRQTPHQDRTLREIQAAQALILDDPVLLDAVHARLAAGKDSAAQAWRAETTRLADSYAAMEDAYLRARATDLRDIAARVLRSLSGTGQDEAIRPSPPAILLIDELLPSQAMACDPSCVLGVLARTGSPTAHAGIIIRSLGIPMVVAPDHAPVAPASLLAIDGGSGEIWIDPTKTALVKIEARRQALVAARAADEGAKSLPAMTQDGQRIEVLANVGTAADAARARTNGAEGVGLFRTEFLYLAREEMPDEEQQTQALTEVLTALGEGPIVIRTPDIGADKPLPFMPTNEEHNPFLGVRGLRLSFRHPDFFASNLRAILRAGIGRDIWIMFPMVTDVEEMREARRFAETAHRDLLASGLQHCWPVKLGMMIEVPAAAIRAERFTPAADFFSVGTNDLTQYVLAAERGNNDLAGLQDAAHPAVLRTIAEICAKAGDTHLSVCGDAASDPLTASLMIGVGVRSLSVRPNQVAAIKAQIRKYSVERLAAIARDAMACDSAAAARRLAAEALGTSNPGAHK